MSKSYIRFIGYVQTIAIILVVLGHSLHEYPDGDNGRSLVIYRMIYSFHMPLFIFISGFLLAYSNEEKLKLQSKGYVREFVLSKIRRLIIPYVTLTAVTFVPRTLMSSLADDDITLTADNFVRAFIMPESMPIPYFWFLQTAFTLLVAVFLIMALMSRLKMAHIVTDILLISVSAFLLTADVPTNAFSLGMTMRMCLFFVAGIIYCHFHEKADDIIPWCSPLFLISLSALWALSFFAFENTDLWFICSLTGIAMTVSLAKIIDLNNFSFFDHLSGANYIIFLLSWYVNVASQQILAHFIEMPWWVHTALSLIAGIYIPLMFFRLMTNNPQNRFAKTAAFILGQKTSNAKQ